MFEKVEFWNGEGIPPTPLGEGHPPRVYPGSLPRVDQMLMAHRNETLHRAGMLAAFAPIQVPIAAPVIVGTEDTQFFENGHRYPR